MKTFDQIKLLKGLNMLHFASIAIMVSFLPLFLHQRGFSPVEVGLVIGVGPLISMIAQPLWGYISDRYQTVQKVLVLLYSLVIVASIGLFFGKVFYMVVLFAFLFNFVFSPPMPLIDSIVLKNLSSSKATYGSIRVWGSIGFASCALIAGPVLQKIGILNMYLPFWLILILVIICLLFLKDKSETTQKVNQGALKELLHNRFYIWFLFIFMLLFIPNGIFNAMMALHMQSLGGEEPLVGLAWMLVAGSEIPIFYFLAKRLEKYQELTMMGIVAVLYTLRWFVSAFITSPEIFAYFQVTQGIIFAVSWLVTMQAMVRLVPAHLRSTGFALLTAFGFGFAGIIGSISGGVDISNVWLCNHVSGHGLHHFDCCLPVILLSTCDERKSMRGSRII